MKWAHVPFELSLSTWLYIQVCAHYNGSVIYLCSSLNIKNLWYAIKLNYKLWHRSCCTLNVFRGSIDTRYRHIDLRFKFSHRLSQSGQWMSLPLPHLRFAISMCGPTIDVQINVELRPNSWMVSCEKESVGVCVCVYAVLFTQAKYWQIEFGGNVLLCLHTAYKCIYFQKHLKFKVIHLNE